MPGSSDRQLTTKTAEIRQASDEPNTKARRQDHHLIELNYNIKTHKTMKERLFDGV